MSGFPWTKSGAPHVFDVRRVGGLTSQSFNLQRLRDTLYDNLMDTTVPTDTAMVSSEEITWGWCWLDDLNPVSVDRWVCFGIRQWVKCPPASLVAAMLEERIRVAKEENPEVKITKEVKASMREELLRNLRIKTPPKIEESPILIDTIDKRVILFDTSEKVRDSILKRVGRILEPQWGKGIAFEEWTLARTLEISRPHGYPADVGQKALTWMAEHALQGLVMRSEHHGLWLTVEIDGTVKLQIDDGTVTVKGDRATKKELDGMAPEAGRIEQIRLWFHVGGGRDYTATIDCEGRIRSGRLVSAQKLNDDYRDKDARLQSYVLDRADDFMTLVHMVHHLFGAFDALKLTEWMGEECEQPSLPFDPTPAYDYTWVDPDAVPEDMRKGQEKPDLDEDEDPRQGGLFSQEPPPEVPDDGDDPSRSTLGDVTGLKVSVRDFEVPDGLNAKQLDRLRAAEVAAGNRKGVLRKIDKAISEALPPEAGT